MDVVQLEATMQILPVLVELFPRAQQEATNARVCTFVCTH
jgi:hypothetical protein